MSKSKADISNSAIRIFLHRVGSEYDRMRGYKPFSVNRPEWKETLEFFDNRCCFCEKKLRKGYSGKDHLIPTNRTSLGLHAWGNIAPCCSTCNSKKHHQHWEIFVKGKAGVRAKIRKFMKKFRYDVRLEIGDVTRNLYQDVGAVSGALIQLRLEQAKDIISRSLSK